MTPDALQRETENALNRWAGEGASHRPAGTALPRLSHICFKFTGEEEYRAAAASARALGAVSQMIHAGKEITWCRLRAPVLHLEWLELVQPKTEQNSYNGVISIGYAVPELSDTVKIPSADGRVIFRYQSRHAAELAV